MPANHQDLFYLSFNTDSASSSCVTLDKSLNLSMLSFMSTEWVNYRNVNLWKLTGLGMPKRADKTSFGVCLGRCFSDQHLNQETKKITHQCRGGYHPICGES